MRVPAAQQCLCLSMILLTCSLILIVMTSLFPYVLLSSSFVGVLMMMQDDDGWMSDLGFCQGIFF
jgi:hypothetical protein